METIKVKYYITCFVKGRDLFLIDRNKCRTSWWTDTLSSAIGFFNKEKAELQCKKLRYNEPRVVTTEEAQELIRLGKVYGWASECDDHVYCSEGLGQWIDD
jgi:hypothetical protein